VNHNRKKSTWRKWPVRVVALVAMLLLGPFGALAFGDLDLETH